MNTFLAAVNTGIAWLNKLVNTVISVINPILIVCSLAGICYAVVVGVKFVKADTKEDREEAKQKLITVLIGIVVTVLLIGLFYFLAFNIGVGEMIDPTNFLS